MTRMFSGKDVLEGLQETKQQLIAERNEWRKASSEVSSTLNDLPREINLAWQYLGEVIVPKLDAAVLDDAAARLALPHIGAHLVAGVRERDRVENEARLRAIEGDVNYREREGYINAAQIRIAEAEDALEPLKQSVSALRDEMYFDELMGVGYGTEAYTGKFWQTSYYRHWKYGDEIVERHAKRLGVNDFAGIRHKFLNEREAMVPLEAVVRENQQLLKQIFALEQEHTQVSEALQQLDARALGWARGRVREHLGALPPDEMTKLLQAQNEWRVAGARVLGLAAKELYLKEMKSQVFHPFEDEARTALGDIDRQIGKMSRPKKWYEQVDQQTYEKRIGRRRVQKWRSRRGEVYGASHSIIVFDNYDRYDPVRDYLWWDVMTGGRHSMPFSAHSHGGAGSAVMWGDNDDVQFKAAHASARASRDVQSRDRDFS